MESDRWFNIIMAVMVGIFVFLFVVVVTSAVHSSSPENKARDAWVMRDAIVRNCLESETYSREECITLAREAK